jgi:hypothetical protein
LVNSIVEYVQRQGAVAMEEVVREAPGRFLRDGDIPGQDQMEAVSRGDDLNGSTGDTTTVLCYPRILCESGKMGLRTDHMATCVIFLEGPTIEWGLSTI